MGSQLRWLERTPDKREVDGSIPFEPTKLTKSSQYSTLKNIQKKVKFKVNQSIHYRKIIILLQLNQTNKEAMLNIEDLLTMKNCEAYENMYSKNDTR